MAKEEKDMSWLEPLLGIRSSSPPPPPPPAAAAKDHEDLIPDPEDTALTTSSEEDDALQIEEVKLTVPETDDPSMPGLTFRTWVIGTFLCIFLSFVNQFFHFRTAPITISGIAGQMVSLYLGQFMASVLPDWTIGGVRINPGPFNIKEHVLITLLAHSGGGIKESTAKGVEAIALIKLPAFYKTEIPFIAALVLIISTQVLGYGWAGLLRKYLVEPANMWWPASLVDVSLFRALHEKEDSKGIHRLHFFTIAAICSFTWYILPGYMFATISALSWICWTWKDSIFAHQLGSGLTGLGLTAFSFDWATISAILSSPLATPWSTLVNVYIGFLVAAYIITPLLYWGDLFHTKRFPIITNKLFLSNGHRYNVSEVVAGDGLTLDLQKYETYGAPHMSAFYAVLHWGLMFAALGATIVHVMLWHGKAIYRQYKTNPMEHKQSIHTKLMQKYKDVPSWWFWAFIIGNALIAMVIMQTWKHIFQLPWWGVLLSMFLNMFFTLPIGVLAATTNRFTGIGPLCDILTGYMFPGYPMANVFFRMYSAESIVQGLAYLRCSKLGHYMKIPPRELFTVLVCGAVLAGLVNLACAYWLFEGVGNICVESGAWSCPVTANTFSVITLWGLVGSSRLLGATGEYRNLRWFFLLGALAPIPFWVIAKTSPKLKVYAKAANFPLLFGAASQWPPATPVTYNSWFVTGYIFNHLLFKHRRRWWQRYNYILSAGLDTGVAFAGPLIFLTLLYFGKSGPTWWGNPTHYLDHCPLSYCPTAKGINVTAQYHFCPVH